MSDAETWGTRAKIVVTLGPATDRPDVVEALIRAGADVMRLNFSHGTHDEHAQRIEWVRAASERLDRPVAILQDLQGPKIRTGPLAGDTPVRLLEGAELTLTTQPVAGSAARLALTGPAAPSRLAAGDRLLLSDGRLALRVLGTTDTEIRTRVERGGLLGESQGVNLPGVPIDAPSLAEKDEADLEFGLARGVDWVALSFVRRPEDLERARALIEARGRATPLIAKIERPEAVERLGEVLAASDGVMVARGDLGVEMGPERVPALQHRIVEAARTRGMPSIVATQMLETMIEQPLPTRAEASDVANAVWDGADALMLSGETAVGRDPVAAVETMARIMAAAEETSRGGAGQLRGSFLDQEPLDEARAITQAASDLAERVGARAIVALTQTGRTAQLLSLARPRVPILACAPDEGVARQLALWWGVLAVPCQPSEDAEALGQRLLERRLALAGDRVVVVGAMPMSEGAHANFVKIHRLQ
jgi:pyruvate kinase